MRHVFLCVVKLRWRRSATLLTFYPRSDMLAFFLSLLNPIGSSLNCQLQIQQDGLHRVIYLSKLLAKKESKACLVPNYSKCNNAIQTKRRRRALEENHSLISSQLFWIAREPSMVNWVNTTSSSTVVVVVGPCRASPITSRPWNTMINHHPCWLDPMLLMWQNWRVKGVFMIDTCSCV